MQPVHCRLTAGPSRRARWISSSQQLVQHHLTRAARHTGSHLRSESVEMHEGMVGWSPLQNGFQGMWNPRRYTVPVMQSKFLFSFLSVIPLSHFGRGVRGEGRPATQPPLYSQTLSPATPSSVTLHNDNYRTHRLCGSPDGMESTLRLGYVRRLCQLPLRRLDCRSVTRSLHRWLLHPPGPVTALPILSAGSWFRASAHLMACRDCYRVGQISVQPGVL